MPKETFLKLNEQKRKRFRDAFLREFSIRKYDEASLSEVVKNLEIAKGSVYQYFEGKLDLFQYLISECSSVKMKYVQSIERKSYPDFWSYFRDLYVHGYQFDVENPLESHFLHNLVQNLNSPSIKEMFDVMMIQTISAFEKMVDFEIKSGLFGNKIPVKVQAFMLYKVGISIQEYLEFSGIINPQESINKNQPVYRGKKDEMLEVVDHFIQLTRPSFDKI